MNSKIWWGISLWRFLTACLYHYGPYPYITSSSAPSSHQTLVSQLYLPPTTINWSPRLMPSAHPRPSLDMWRSRWPSGSSMEPEGHLDFHMASLSFHNDIPRFLSPQCHENPHHYLWKLHIKHSYVGCCQLITVIACYLGTFYLYRALQPSTL